jgi:hypothetical protein
MFLTLIEATLFALILLIVFSQIIIPFIRGTSPFPFFRKEANLQKSLEEARQRDVEESLQKIIKKQNERAAK